MVHNQPIVIRQAGFVFSNFLSPKFEIVTFDRCVMLVSCVAFRKIFNNGGFTCYSPLVRCYMHLHNAPVYCTCTLHLLSFTPRCQAENISLLMIDIYYVIFTCRVFLLFCSGLSFHCIKHATRSSNAILNSFIHLSIYLFIAIQINCNESKLISNANVKNKITSSF